MKSNVSERLLNINSDTIDLLQLHWQDVSSDNRAKMVRKELKDQQYEDPQYIRMAQLVEQDPRVLNVGLCNFDTQRMEEIVESGVKIVSNQVQVRSPCSNTITEVCIN